MRRLIVPVVVVALLAWLILEPGPDESREKLIRSALEDGRIGQLDAPRTLALAELLKSWTAGMGLDVEIAINQPPVKGRLNIYTTTPAAMAITGVGLGNAAFDPALDAIFIDTFFLDPNPYQKVCQAAPESAVLSCREEMPSQRLLLAFIFLHEVGHRVLHGRHSFVVASDPASAYSRRLEQEADTFAFAHLRKLYGAGQRVSGDSQDILLDAFRQGPVVPRNGVSDAEFWPEVASSLTIAVLMNSFLPLPYSPLYHDAAHPSLVDRALQMVDGALAQKAIGDDVRATLLTLRPLLARQARMAETAFVEVLVPEPITNAALGAQGLLTRGRTTGQVFLADPKALEPGRPGLAARVVAAIPQGASVAPTNPSEEAPVFWATGSAGLVLADGSTQGIRIDGGGTGGTPFPVNTNNCFAIWLSQEADHAVTFSCASASDLLQVVGPANVRGKRTLQGILVDARRRLANAEAELQVVKFGCARPPVFVAQDTVSLTVQNGHGSYLGVMRLAVPTLETVDVKTLQFPRGAAADTGAVFESRDSSGQRVAWFAGQAEGVPAHQWGVWRLDEHRTPQLVAAHDYMMDESSGARKSSLQRGKEFQVCEAMGVARGLAVINIENDGVYLVDLRGASVRILFPIGGPQMRVVAHAATRRVAVYTPGASKAYVFAP